MIEKRSFFRFLLLVVLTLKDRTIDVVAFCDSRVCLLLFFVDLVIQCNALNPLVQMVKEGGQRDKLNISLWCFY